MPSGYELQATIWKALKTHSKTIHTTLEKYNKATLLLDPPAAQLEWKQLIFVSEFKLLKPLQSHKDITMELWAVPANHEVTMKYFKILRAHEKI